MLYLVRNEVVVTKIEYEAHMCQCRVSIVRHSILKFDEANDFTFLESA